MTVGPQDGGMRLLLAEAADDLQRARVGDHIKLAVTADDEMNSTVAREYSSLFGSANTYQLRRADAGTTSGPASRASSSE